MRTMMNEVRTKLSDEELDHINGGIIVYDNDTGKYWVFNNTGELYHPSFSYDQQSAIEHGLMTLEKRRSLLSALIPDGFNQ